MRDELGRVGARVGPLPREDLLEETDLLAEDRDAREESREGGEVPGNERSVGASR